MIGWETVREHVAYRVLMVSVLSAWLFCVPRSAFPIGIVRTERSFLDFTCRSPRSKRGISIPGIDFDRVRAEITMQQVQQLLGFQPNRRRGDQRYGRCPLPGWPPSRRACFSVNVTLGRYYCHRCQRRGHQLELWATVTGLPLHRAAIDLCATLGRDVPWVHPW